ncbi:MAG: hypothetical protein H7X92_11760 [Chitinophagales bacterium]|nr:hypothetical protein [Hyphomicrobiales bacterium]
MQAVIEGKKVKKLQIGNSGGFSDCSVGFLAENQAHAISLARMLSFAADEAGEIGAQDCQLLVTLALRDLKEQFGLKYDDIIEMCPDLN